MMPEEKGIKLTDKILRLFQGTGKPFTANAILKELPKEEKKTNVEKALCKLVDSEEVVEKTFGKKKLYFAKQTKVDSSKLLELRNKLNENINLLDRELLNVEQAVKTLESEVRQQTDKGKQDPDQKLSDAELQEAIDEMQKRLDSLVRQKEKILAANGPKKCKQSKAVYEKAWRQRKRMVRDVMDAVLENSEMTKQKLIEDIGLETDEDAGVSLP
ncbi:homologous-pairing protein 2 homolog [Neocloeon triangulifer]|uniref:homologous-pairing protein 2 homolog n=1 Tax=Neocloeon triangulifer TaxID=2078957 RepID=UPI00286F7E57|nr:homologous-pairing protein 2 homolog [Neocloeon triangulifer]